MDNKEKRRMGFKTPYMGLEEEFNEVGKMLEERRVKWSQLGERLLSKNERLKEELDKALTSFKGSKHLLITLMVSNRCLVNATLLTISRLGIDIAEVHERLADCEKAIKEMSHIIKKISPTSY